MHLLPATALRSEEQDPEPELSHGQGPGQLLQQRKLYIFQLFLHVLVLNKAFCAQLPLL